MSTVPPPPPPRNPATTNSLTGTPPRGPRQIKIVSHSPIFYWWPIWVLGYVMALLTLTENNRLAILPADTKVHVTAWADDAHRQPKTIQLETAGSTRQLDRAVGYVEQGDQPFRARISQRPWMGPLYCTILLLTILITNIPLRGLWSFLVILMVVMLALIISLVPSGWEDLLGTFGNLHIYINMAGYLFIATTVLILWVVSVFIFDQRTYMIVSPGSISVCEHIGAAVRNFDTTGLAFEKQRDDLFRHWILGFFSGDLIVRTAGAERETIRLPNVLWIGWRLEEMQRLMHEKMMVESR